MRVQRRRRRYEAVLLSWNCQRSDGFQGEGMDLVKVQREVLVQKCDAVSVIEVSRGSLWLRTGLTTGLRVDTLAPFHIEFRPRGDHTLPTQNADPTPPDEDGFSLSLPPRHLLQIYETKLLHLLRGSHTSRPFSFTLYRLQPPVS